MSNENDLNMSEYHRGCRVCAGKMPDPRAVREQIQDARATGHQISPELERAAFGLCSAECEAQHDAQRALAKMNTRGIIS